MPGTGGRDVPAPPSPPSKIASLGRSPSKNIKKKFQISYAKPLISVAGRDGNGPASSLDRLFSIISDQESGNQISVNNPSLITRGEKDRRVTQGPLGTCSRRGAGIPSRTRASMPLDFTEVHRTNESGRHMVAGATSPPEAACLTAGPCEAFCRTAFPPGASSSGRPRAVWKLPLLFGFIPFLTSYCWETFAASGGRRWPRVAEGARAAWHARRRCGSPAAAGGDITCFFVWREVMPQSLLTEEESGTGPLCKPVRRDDAVENLVAHTGGELRHQAGCRSRSRL